MSRILVIGLDAADLDLIEPWVTAGHLPHIGRILQSGAYAPMRTTLPVMSPPAWTSMISGLNPGKHGIYDFVRLLPGSYRLTSVRRDQTNFRTIFDHASAHNRSVIAMNIPVTYPPATVRGVMVAGLGAPETGQFAYPSDLRDELLHWGYRLDTDVAFAPGREQEWLADLTAVTHSQTQAMVRLMQREPWELAMIVYRAIDEVETFFWHHMDATHPQHDPHAVAQFGSAILDIHRMLDTEVGKLIDTAGPETTVVLASDHGGGPQHKEVFLNVWLEQQGWLHRQQPRRLNKLRKNMMRHLHLTRENLAPILDWPLAWKIRNRIPMQVQHALVPEATVTLADIVDWSQTCAYSMGNIGQIYVNLQGREPEGIVAPGLEYEQLLDKITAALFELKDDGQPVVDAVYRSRDIYHGPYAAYGPDLNVIMRGMAYTAQSWREMAGAEIFSISGTHYTGIHRPVGMLALSGPLVTGRGRQPEVQILDVAPTILAGMDLPLPDEIDGRCLSELLGIGHVNEPSAPHTSITSDRREVERDELNPTAWATPDEEEEVLARLRDLGYLE
jgi:predicted AlkP superfamily phosphohydrolase/phosphomutase